MLKNSKTILIEAIKSRNIDKSRTKSKVTGAMFNYDTDGDNFDKMSDMGLNRNRKSIKSKAQFSMHKDF